MMIYETNSPEDTFRLGEEIGRNASPGEVYTLTGDLGVGKLYLPRAWLPDLA